MMGFAFQKGVLRTFWRIYRLLKLCGQVEVGEVEDLEISEATVVDWDLYMSAEYKAALA